MQLNSPTPPDNQLDLGKLTEQERWSYEVMDARFELIEELIDMAQSIEIKQAGSTLYTQAVTTSQLETKRRKMMPDYNALQAKAKAKL